jgi:hypothetical protein
VNGVPRLDPECKSGRNRNTSNKCGKECTPLALIASRKHFIFIEHHCLFLSSLGGEAVLKCDPAKGVTPVLLLASLDTIEVPPDSSPLGAFCFAKNTIDFFLECFCHDCSLQAHHLPQWSPHVFISPPPEVCRRVDYLLQLHQLHALLATTLARAAHLSEPKTNAHLVTEPDDVSMSAERTFFLASRTCPASEEWPHWRPAILPDQLFLQCGAVLKDAPSITATRI